MGRQVRAWLADLRVDLRPYQRSYCYLNGEKVGYAVPLRDSLLRRPWGWVATDMMGNTLAVTASLAEAKTLCFVRASDKLRSYIPRFMTMDAWE